MENNKNLIQSVESEDEGLNLLVIIRDLWNGRKTVFLWFGIFAAIGLLAALTMKRTYRVKTIIVPRMNTNQNYSLGSLAVLAGADMAMMANTSDLSPLVYPEIVNSIPYRLELMHTPLHYEKCEYPISMFDCALLRLYKPTVFEFIMRYTIGLPWVLMEIINGRPEEIEYNFSDSTGTGTRNDVIRPIIVTVDEQKMLNGFNSVVSLDVDKMNGYITLAVNGIEPIQTAELAMKALALLQDEVTRHRIEKSRTELEYIESRYNEIKKENEYYQEQLAIIRDRTKNVPNTRDVIEKERIQVKYNMSQAVFIELSKQLEQAKMQVKKDTPTFAVIQPVTIPMKASNSRAVVLIIWMFFGFIIGCSVVIGKGYMQKLKAMLKKPEEETATA